MPCPVKSKDIAFCSPLVVLNLVSAHGKEFLCDYSYNWYAHKRMGSAVSAVAYLVICCSFTTPHVFICPGVGGKEISDFLIVLLFARVRERENQEMVESKKATTDVAIEAELPAKSLTVNPASKSAIRARETTKTCHILKIHLDGSVDVEKFCSMNIYLQKSVPAQPKIGQICQNAS